MIYYGINNRCGFYFLVYAHTEYKHGWGMCAIDCFGFLREGQVPQIRSALLMYTGFTRIS